MGHVPSKKFNQRLLSRIYSIINIQNTDTGAREMAWQLSAGLVPNTHMGQLISTCNNCRGQSIWLPRAHTLMCPNLTTTKADIYTQINKIKQMNLKTVCFHWLSVAVINITKSNLGKEIVYLASRLQSIVEGSQDRNLRPETEGSN